MGMMPREWSQLPGTIPCRWFDLKHCGAEVGKNFATIWTCDALGKFQNLYIG